MSLIYWCPHGDSSRYESGKTKPPVALVKLFKLLSKHPELFEEIAGDRAKEPSLRHYGVQTEAVHADEVCSRIANDDRKAKETR